MKCLLHFVRAAVVNDDDVSATFGKHLMSVGVIHGSPKNNSRFHGHASTPNSDRRLAIIYLEFSRYNKTLRQSVASVYRIPVRNCRVIE
jgi:hypothetical protein